MLYQQSQQSKVNANIQFENKQDDYYPITTGRIFVMSYGRREYPQVFIFQIIQLITG